MTWFNLAQDSAFCDQLKCRWLELRKTTLSLDHIYNVIDSVTVAIEKEQIANFSVWPILGKNVWPNAKPIEPDYAGEIRRLKEWFLLRLTWMDAYMPGECR